MGDKGKKRRREEPSEEEDNSTDDDDSSGEERPASKERKAGKSKRESSRKGGKKAKKGKKEKKDKDKDKRLLKEAKKFLKQKLKGEQQGGALEAAPAPDATPLAPGQAIDELTSEDYFAKNAEFTTWLRESRRLMFNDLTTERARELFEAFVQQWNARKLPARYYNGEGMDGTAMRRTTHAWGIRGAPQGVAAAPHGLAAAMEDDRERFATQRARERTAQKEHRAEQREALDDLLGPRPDAGSREARQEKRAVARAEKRAREESPDLAPLPGGGGADPYGGGDSFAAAKARQARSDAFRQRKAEVRRSELDVRLQAHQAKEDATMDRFRSLLQGQTGPLTIPKRS